MRCIATLCLILLFVFTATKGAVGQENKSDEFQDVTPTMKSDQRDGSLHHSSFYGVDVITLRSPSFGSFYCGVGGGKIIVHQDGTRTAEGDVILMNSGGAVAPALFEVRCEPFMMLQLFSDQYFTLHGEDGQELRAKIISTDPSFPLVAPGNSKQGITVAASVCLEINSGQTLSPGNYNGIFQLNWITE
ncbi:MAG: DUF4402 domain-containing protein [Flavobacteriales bacterium]|nr:DUF4402 domain-containing protein [Flavobacteriales bacterium]